MTTLPDMAVVDGLMHQASAHGDSFGAVRNPYDPTRIPGGSSGGSGAILAARIVPAALGTDANGSIRCPSAFCGVTGVRPSTGGDDVPRTTDAGSAVPNAAAGRRTDQNPCAGFSALTAGCPCAQYCRRIDPWVTGGARARCAAGSRRRALGAGYGGPEGCGTNSRADVSMNEPHRPYQSRTLSARSVTHRFGSPTAPASSS
jgi:Amidase